MSIKKIIPKFYGHVLKGKLSVARKDIFEKYLQTLEGNKVEILIKKTYKKRSLNQNAYYWGAVLPPIADWIGCELEEVHIALKYELGLVKYITIGSRDVRVPISTSVMRTLDFGEYIDKIKRWALINHNIYIPDPFEAGYEYDDKK